MSQLPPVGTSGTTVVIPVGGVDERLGRQLRAVLAQDYTGFDVVLSLNTSAPGARDALDSLIPTDERRRISVVDSSDRRGAAHARNVGARSTSAATLAFCDADDLVHPGWLAALVAGLAEHDAVCGQVIDVFPDDRMARWHPPATPGTLPSFLGRPYALTGNLAVRRSAYEAAGGFDETISRCEDIAFGWSLADAGCTLGYAPDARLDYHHRPGLVPMLRQHFAYGCGMSEVLRRYGVPVRDDCGTSRLGALRPNGQKVARRTLGGHARRGALAAGRVWGTVVSRRTARGSTGVVA